MKKIVKHIVFVLLMIVLGGLVWNYQLVYYGLKQGAGQLTVVLKARPVDEILSDPLYPDSLKVRISLIQEIRQFAFDSLGINYSDNYTTFYNQEDKPLLWVVTGAEPFKLVAREWKFPFLGSFTYKGFFDYEMAVKEKDALLNHGLDAAIDEVEGWSTLGWFKDPILSNMLKRPAGGLANLIIHELTHGTLYIKDNVQYNENLASFVGDRGALLFLEYKYGRGSDEYRDYVKRKELSAGYIELVLNGADQLDSLYASFRTDMPYEKRQEAKEEKLRELIAGFKDYLAYYKDREPAFYNRLDSINNTYFLSYRTYRQDQDMFEMELNESFNGNFKEYLNYLKRTYPSL